MTVIQPIFTSLLLDYIDQIATKCKVMINNEPKQLPVFKKLRIGDSVRIYFYLTNERGYVGDAQLISANNDVLAIKPVDVEKLDDGLAIAFDFEVRVIVKEVDV